MKLFDKQKNNTPVRGVIFDMDGVILDTEKLYVRFWCEAAQFYGFPMKTPHALGIRSLSGELAEKKLQALFGAEFNYQAVRQKRIERMNAYIAQHGVEVKPGAQPLLQWLKENGFQTALATATAAPLAKTYLAQTGLLPYFDCICSARQVPHGKPAPDIYCYAAGCLGLSPEECLALEDSQNGVRSAAAAGCRTVLVPDLDNPEKELKGLLYAVAALEEVSALLTNIQFLVNI